MMTIFFYTFGYFSLKLSTTMMEGSKHVNIFQAKPMDNSLAVMEIMDILFAFCPNYFRFKYKKGFCIASSLFCSF